MKVTMFTRRMCGGCQDAKRELANMCLLDQVEIYEIDTPHEPYDIAALARLAAARGEYEYYAGANRSLPLFVIDHPVGAAELTHDVQRVIEHMVKAINAALGAPGMGRTERGRLRDGARRDGVPELHG